MIARSSRQRPAARRARVSLRLRPARAADARLLLRWSNDPVTRAASFNNAPIAWETHRAWFARKLAAPRSARIYVALDEAGRPAGQVRFERGAPGRATISVSVAPRQRGRGLGARLIALGCRRAARDLGVGRVLAYIRQDNLASIGAFTRAGFRHLRRVTVGGAPSVLMVWVG